MQKKKYRQGVLCGFLALILIAASSCASAAQKGNAMVSLSATATAVTPSAAPTPSTGVLAAETTTEAQQSPKASATATAKAPADATPTPTSTGSAAQPALLASMMSKSKLTIGKLSGSQLVMVVYEKGNTKLYCYEKGSDGIWKLSFGPVTANVGRNGVSSNKVEGDGKTPLGLYDFGFAFGNASKPDTSMTYRKVTSDSYWVDDPQSRFYNTWVEGTSQKDWDSAEHLSEMKTAYEYAVVIEYNMNPITPGKGSAIFLHCGSKPTAGCVAISRDNLLKVLKWLIPSAKPQILIVSE